MGAYTNHIAALSQEAKGSDKAKLQGYLKKWTDAKYLLGCAVFTDLLHPCSVFSKCLQSDDIDILGALTCLLKTLSETNKLSSKNLENWPTYRATLSKCISEDEQQVYQSQELKKFSVGKLYFESHYIDFCSKICECVRSRLSWSDLQLMRDVIFASTTQGWEKAIEEENDLQAVDRLVKRFSVPLESAGAQLLAIHNEFAEIMEYAFCYLLWTTSLFGGGYLMLSMPQNGQTPSFLLNYYFLCLHLMGNWSEYSLLSL